MPEISITMALTAFLIVVVVLAVKIVPQSEEYVVERFGKFSRKLPAGINFIVPFLDRIAHKISILESQLDEFAISVITKDNVEVMLETTNFYRVIDPARSVYRGRAVGPIILGKN